MADEKPFKVNRSVLPTEDMRQLFNPANCFAKGGLTIKGEKPVLAGNCQVVQFGRNSSGNNCMFVCQANFTESVEQQPPVLASFVFDHLGRTIDFYFGNSDKRPEWRNNIRFGTRASFGFQPPPPPPSSQVPQSHVMLSFRIQEINDQLKKNAKSMTKDEIDLLVNKKARIKEEYEAEAAEVAKAAKEAREAYDKLVKTPRWGCTSVLKGPVTFTGCQRVEQRDPSVSLVERFPYVSCVMAHGEFDDKFDTSDDQIENIKPYFKYDPVTEKSQYGASGTEYYDGEGFGNVHGNLGFESFVVRESNGRITIRETRQGSCPKPKPVPPELSAGNPDTKKEFQIMLANANTSLRAEMKALKWLETHPLVFPTAAIDSTFADTAFDWIHELSIQFEEHPRLSLTPAAMAKMMESRTQASVAAMHSPAMRQKLFAELTKLPVGPKSIFKGCDCTPMDRDPMCQNQLCPFRNARLEKLNFKWPRVRFASVDPAVRKALEDEISGATIAEAAKQEAAAAAAAAKQKREDEMREKRNARARSATARRRESAAAAKAASAASAAPLAPLASAAPSVRRRSAKASAEPEAREVNPPSTDLTDSYEHKTIRRRAKGGAKSKSKSKRRFRK
jgi:hypothetical protein